MARPGPVARKAAVFGAVLLLYALLMWAGVPCLFLTIFSVPCPGCGMSRAVKALVQLHFGEAAAYHPMVFSLPIVLLYIWKDGRVFTNGTLNALVLGSIGLGFGIHYLDSLCHYWAG